MLYVCAEESREQVRLRAERLGPCTRGCCWPPRPTSGPSAPWSSRSSRPWSWSTRSRPWPTRSWPAPGEVGQVREVAAQLVRLAKERSIATFLVGQVTKDGAVAGPKTMEHLVDVVLNFEGDQHHALRLVRCTKNRFGPAYEVGCFEMTEAGLEPLADPSRLFLSARSAGVPGSPARSASRAGGRSSPRSRRWSCPPGWPCPGAPQGLDAGRLAILVAVLDRRARIGLAGNDVFAAAAEVRITEPAADLAVCLALASAARNRQVPSDLITIGEVGLGGEVRPVPQLPRRLAEAARLGFRRALVPATGALDRIRRRRDRAGPGRLGRRVPVGPGHAHPGTTQGSGGEMSLDDRLLDVLRQVAPGRPCGPGWSGSCAPTPAP